MPFKENDKDERQGVPCKILHVLNCVRKRAASSLRKPQAFEQGIMMMVMMMVMLMVMMMVMLMVMTRKGRKTKMLMKRIIDQVGRRGVQGGR